MSRNNRGRRNNYYHNTPAIRETVYTGRVWAAVPEMKEIDDFTQVSTQYTDYIKLLETRLSEVKKQQAELNSIDRKVFRNISEYRAYQNSERTRLEIEQRKEQLRRQEEEARQKAQAEKRAQNVAQFQAALTKIEKHFVEYHKCLTWASENLSDEGTEITYNNKTYTDVKALIEAIRQQTDVGNDDQVLNVIQLSWNVINYVSHIHEEYNEYLIEQLGHNGQTFDCPASCCYEQTEFQYRSTCCDSKLIWNRDDIDYLNDVKIGDTYPQGNLQLY